MIGLPRGWEAHQMLITLSDKLSDAFRLAHELHRGQVRKGSGVPYISHLLAVCAYVLEDGGTEEQAVAALLHDAVEDQGGQATLDLIHSRFGATVADIVEICTDSCCIPKPPWRARKQAFLSSLASAPPEAVRVIAADKLHNLGTIHRDYLSAGDEVWRRFKGGKKGTLWYYHELAEFFNSQELTGLTARYLDEYEAFTTSIRRQSA